MTDTGTLRWRDRRHSWRHSSDGGFDRTHFDVAVIADDTTPRDFIRQHHYSHAYPAAVHRYGLYARGALVGVAVLGVPVSKRTLTLPFPDLVPYRESLELSRFVLLDAVPANAESWFWARCRELAAQAGLGGIVAFSDPIARTTLDGRPVFPGHYGTIYQASNGRWCGRGTARTLSLLPDATVLNARSLQKVRANERGHEAVEQLLRAYGATPRQTGEPGADYLAHALREIGLRRVTHPGNLRYCWSLRRNAQIGIPAQWPYPKRGAA